MKQPKLKRHLAKDSKILETFMGVVDDMQAVCIEGHHPSTVLRYGADGARYFREANERKCERQRLKRLQKKNLIKINKIGDDYIASLTDCGMIELFKQRVINAPMLDEKYVCMVVFDITETHKRLRQLLRRLLKESGFIPIQRSVWVSPFDAGKALIDFLKTKSATQWIRIYNAKEF
jgi:CRISPR/Cas system-associated endoribonuclease Cas2